MLTQPANPSKTFDLPVLQEGSSDPFVLYLQDALQLHGYYTGDRHGQFDPETTRAVQAFQQLWGLAVDGVVGEETWDTLIIHVDRPR